MSQLSNLLVLSLVLSGGLPDAILCIGSNHGAHVMATFVHCGHHAEEGWPAGTPEPSFSGHSHQCSGTCHETDCVDTPLPRVIATVSASVKVPELQESGLGVASERAGLLAPPARSVVTSGHVRQEIPIPAEPLLQTCRMII